VRAVADREKKDEAGGEGGHEHEHEREDAHAHEQEDEHEHEDAHAHAHEHEDEGEHEGEDEGEHEGEDEGEHEDEREGEGDREDEDEGDEDEGEGKGDEEKGEEDVAAAQRVAAALGVGAEEEEKAEEEAPAAPLNRAQRRAEAAQRRKKRKQAATTGKEEEAEAEALPKDKNARAKELLKRRKEQAAEARPIQLLPGEMVDDALARGSSAVTKWLRQNFSIIQWVILAAVVGGGGFVFYQSRADKKVAGASSELMAGVVADHGRVMAEDKRSDEDKENDPTKVFKTAEERADTALAAYQKVVAQHAGTGAAILARLGEAGDYLDKGDYVHALEGFSAVSSSTLAGADPDVKGRALEGLGFAKEGKGDLDGALATFHELESIDAKGYKELGLYHQGRIWLARGEREKAKDFLKQAHDKLEQPTAEGQAHYVLQMTDEMLRRIDPSLVPAKAPMLGGAKGGALTPEQYEKLKRQYEEMMRKQQQKKEERH
jgi:hypothetical protein